MRFVADVANSRGKQQFHEKSGTRFAALWALLAQVTDQNPANESR